MVSYIFFVDVFYLKYFSWDPIINFVDQRFADYLAEETKIERPENIADNRVHLCFYFIAPTGHGLKELDIEFMKALQDRVNIVPVIAKADTLTHEEMAIFKQNVSCLNMFYYGNNG